MTLKFKPDWEETKQRMLAWWNGETIGRCAMAVYAQKNIETNIQLPELPEKIEDRWIDFNYLRESNEYRLSNTYFGGEALPIWNAGYPGWDMIQTYFGTPIDLRETTGWHSPIIADGPLTDHDYKKFRVDPDNDWWKFSQKLHRFMVGEARGKSLPGLHDLGYSGDTLAAMRGSQNLLIDLIECPDYVRAFDMHLLAEWEKFYTILHDITKEGAEGSTSWFALWYPGRFYPTQNDFSCMVSPKMFEEIFIPTIEFQAGCLDKTVYHVDGVDAFAHIPALCDLPGLHAFQVLPGAGKPGPLHYMKTLKYVQSRGKICI